MVKGSSVVQSFFALGISALAVLLWNEYGNDLFKAYVATGDTLVDIGIKIAIFFGMFVVVRLIVGMLFYANNREVARRS
jgi:uncharacterized membrane protein